MTSTTRTFRSKTLRFTAVGLAATGLCVVGAGMAAAANPTSSFGQAVGTTAHAAGVKWSAMPGGYTEAQYEAFWGAGFSPEDQLALEELWSLDSTETKSQAGQMILDGEKLPFEPGTHTTPELPVDEQAAIAAFFDAGYTVDEAALLNELWETEDLETKVHAGELLLAGETLPVAPGEAAATSTDS